MLSRPYRLPLSNQPFKGTSLFGSYIKLIYNNTSLSHSRIGIVIPKKHLLLASDRNLFKRRLHSLILPHLHANPSLDLLIISKPSLASATYNLLQTDLNQLLNQARNQLSANTEPLSALAP